MSHSDSLLRSIDEFDELLALLQEATVGLATPSKSLQTALQCLPHLALAELVTLAEVGHQGLPRTLIELQLLVRLTIKEASPHQLVLRLLQPSTIELIAVGLQRISDLPRLGGARSTHDDPAK